ncbi:autotransporter outer membrane beta-barrel domain-containing protein [Paracoccus aestuariivivens]|uniref:DUF2219 family protein n=1 Tax=Paracoccus aestuariivivens TaxID=1820333 RepID=A0A6L6JEE1_9RHOB|nr:autotransporter outer membrane beta-barrel domain-containing protein [Paracoccus aestuariivivens]MTH79595.1 hypothetical protein [Paracoccus aestuariivivens]
MNRYTLPCAALAALCANAASAEGLPQGFTPPPGVMAQINLGEAGLLPSFYSNEVFGTVQGRIGQARATYGAASVPGAPQTGYEDSSSALVMPMTALQALPDGKSFIRYTLAATLGNGKPNPVELDGRFTRLDVQYLTFPDADTMYAFGAVLGRSTVDVVGSGTVEKHEFGLRGDMLRKFNANWGIAARAEYVLGDQDKSIRIAPGITLDHKQDDNRFYTQAELIGTYRSDETALAPEGWVLRPILGAQFQRNFLEETRNSFGALVSGPEGDTEDYGTVWAKIGLQKAAAPGQWSPMASIGLEHEWTNTLDKYVDDPDFVVASLGASMVTKSGAGIVANYTRHEGLNGKRANDCMTFSLNVPF